MAHAASAVRSIASGERSDVLALPRRLPKYTVMPRPLSRLYSTVSTSPRRTVTDWPTAAETSTSEPLAPFDTACAIARRAMSVIAARGGGRGQYSGRIMRDIDAGPMAAQLAQMEAPSKRQTAVFHVAERWRTDLLEQPDAIARFVKEYPEADPNRLRELAEKAREEKRTSKPLRRYRELFHVLNAFLQDHARPNP